MEARSAKVSIPDVEACLYGRALSSGGVDVALLRTPEVGLDTTGEAAERWAIAAA